jgi:cyclase
MRSAKSLGLIAGLALAALPALAQDRDFSKIEVTAVPVAGNIYMLQGAGGNIGVSVGKDGLLIVDDQFAPLADKIKAALKGLNAGKLEFILNTHWHGDHTGGNEIFGREAPVIAHDNVRKRMAAGQMIRGEQVPPAAPGALPVVTFGESLSIHFNGEEIKAIHFPKGHTDGDSIIFFTGANVVHMGDEFFAGRFPFVDLESGGTVQGLTENVGKVLAEIPANAKVIPGHGPLSTVEDLKNFHRMLVETTDAVRKGMAAGKTLKEIQAAGLPEAWKEYGSGFINTENWIATIHASFSPGEHTHADGTHH